MERSNIGGINENLKFSPWGNHWTEVRGSGAMLPVKVDNSCDWLAARIHAVLRRTNSGTGKEPPNPAVLYLDDIRLDTRARLVQHKTRDVELTSAEFELLALFFKAPGQLDAGVVPTGPALEAVSRFSARPEAWASSYH